MSTNLAERSRQGQATRADVARPEHAQEALFAKLLAFALVISAVIFSHRAEALDPRCILLGGQAECTDPIEAPWGCTAGVPALLQHQCGSDGLACPTASAALSSLYNPQYPLCFGPVVGAITVREPIYHTLGKESRNSFDGEVTVGFSGGPSCAPGTYTASGMCTRAISCPPGFGPVGPDGPCRRLKPETCPVGNPIQCGSGEKLQIEVDIPGGSGSDLEFVRYYSSTSFYTPPGLSRSHEILGQFWRHSYQRNVTVEGSLNGHALLAHVVRADGDYRHFRWNGTTWIGRTDKSESLTELVVGGQVVGWRFTTSNDDTEEYDASGALLRISAKSGRILNLSYSDASVPATIAPGAGYLIAVTDESGRAFQFRYAADGSLSRLIDANGGETTFGFATGRLLTTVVHPDLTVRSYLYNEPAHLVTALPAFFLLTGIVDEDGVRFATFKYNDYGNAVETVHAGGADRTRVSYPVSLFADTPYSLVTDALGQQRTRYFVSINGVLKDAGTQQPSCATPGCSPVQVRTTVTYDANGNKDKFTDFRGIITDHDFNTRGLETQRIDVANASCPVAVPNCLLSRRTIQTDWHASLRVPTERRTYNASSQLEQVTRYAYNARGQQTARCLVEPANPGAMAYSCGSLANAPLGVRQSLNDYCDETDADFGSASCPRVGLLKSVNGPRIDVADVTTYSYRAADDAQCAAQPTTCAYRKGDLWKTTNALGQVTEVLRHDGAGRVLSLLDANGVVTDVEYTPRGWLSRRIVRGFDNNSESDDAITAFEYEPYGAINKVTQPDGSFLRYHYDQAHRLVAVSDAGNDRIDYTLDAAGNRLKETTKDPNGNVKRLLARQFDTLSRMRSQINAPYADMPNLDDPAVKKSRFTYDANGNSETATDALDVVTDNDYDALNRLIKSIGDQGGINADSRFRYDARDNLREVTDPKGLVTTYNYDGLGNLMQLVSPDTGTTTYAYDAAGNRVTQTDARGVVVNYSFDALNRLSLVTHPSAPGLNISFTYDASAKDCAKGERFGVGRLTEFSDADGKTLFCRDRRGNVVRKVVKVSGSTFVTRWTYDSADRVLSIVYPSGSVVTYARDSRGRIAQVMLKAGGTGPTLTLVNAVEYLPFGPVARIQWGNGEQMARSYDQNYWVDLIDSSSAAGLDLDFTTDVVGNIVGVGAPGVVPPANSFDYDNLYRLTSTTDAAAQNVEAYSYDATGNRLSKQPWMASPEIYSYAPGSHRLASVGGIERLYDANGNTIDRGSGGSFIYDARNRLSVYSAGRASVTYKHNARGERVLKSGFDLGLRFHYDEGGRLLAETDVVEGATRDVIWLDNLPIATYATGQGVHYIEPDHLGSPRQLVTPAGNAVVWRWPLLDNAFGEQPANEDADGDGTFINFNLRFPGQYYDRETNLHYNYFRDYDPTTGRYIESDPIGQKGGFSTYAYVGSSVLRYVDPFGLEHDWGTQWRTPPERIPKAWCNPGERPKRLSGDNWTCESDPFSPNPEPWCANGDCAAFPKSCNNDITLTCIRKCFDDLMPNIPTWVSLVGGWASVVTKSAKPGGASVAWGTGVGVGCWISCTFRGAE